MSLRQCVLLEDRQIKCGSLLLKKLSKAPRTDHQFKVVWVKMRVHFIFCAGCTWLILCGVGGSRTSNSCLLGTWWPGVGRMLQGNTWKGRQQKMASLHLLWYAVSLQKGEADAMSLDGGFIYIAGKCGLVPVLAENYSKWKGRPSVLYFF